MDGSEIVAEETDGPVTGREDELSNETNEARISPASGLYWSIRLRGGLTEGVAGGDEDTRAGLLRKEELRLDVDGRYPLMTASGVIPGALGQETAWIAALTATAVKRFTGGIWYKDPVGTSFAYTTVKIALHPSPLAINRKATVTFSGAGLQDRVRHFRFRARAFRHVEFEFDHEKGVTPVTELDTGAHPNRPGALPVEVLPIRRVYQRAGFSVATSGAVTEIPQPSGTNTQWSDQEMHDAMQVYWSHFANTAQWALWTLFARQHESGASLGGIMFDDIGPNHRQGTSIFYDSFISEQPTGDPAPAAFAARMRFWTAVHEMGHSFNLAHSWQKSLTGQPGQSAWIPLADEPEARSFMNYPYNVNGGSSAFFADFEYRFSDQELLFMRHAPARFVQQGNADWFDQHGFHQAYRDPDPKLSIEIRVNRGDPTFEFLEPVVAEIKIKNTSSAPQIFDESILASLDGITIVTKRRGQPAQQLVPYARYCMRAMPRVLQPGEAAYGSVYLSAGRDGRGLAEPGYYVVQAALHQAEGDVVSPPIQLRLTPPRGYEEEYLAQDFFSDEVTRTLAFDGTRVLARANATLQEVVDRLEGRRVVHHARIALGKAMLRPGRVLELKPAHQTRLVSAASMGASIKVEAARPEAARRELKTALLGKDRAIAAESLGHIDYKDYVDVLSDCMAQDGDRAEAVQAQNEMLAVLEKRQVLPAVLDQVKARRDGYGAGKAAKAGR